MDEISRTRAVILCRTLLWGIAEVFWGFRLGGFRGRRAQVELLFHGDVP